MKKIKEWGEECLIIADLNRPVNKPRELLKTRLLTDWIDTGEVILLNNPKMFTRFDSWKRLNPRRFVTLNLHQSVRSFSVDRSRNWTPHGLKYKKDTSP